MKDLWENFAKLLLIQAELYNDSENLSESGNVEMTNNLELLIGSLKGLFFLKSLRLNSHIEKIIENNTGISNRLDALANLDESKLNEENNTDENREKVQIIKLMNFVQGKNKWKISVLAQEVYGNNEESSNKKIQGLLMKCMKQKLLTAKINRKENSIKIM